MAHELAGALQQASRIWQRCAVKEPHVYMRAEYIDVAEGRISQTCHRTAVMQKLPDFVPAFSHHLKPLMRDGSQFTGMLFHPRIDGGIPLDSAVESQQFRSHPCSTFRSRDYSHVAPPPRIGNDASRRLAMTCFRSDNRAMIPTSISPMLSVRRGAAAVEFYKSALGAAVVYRVDGPDGTVVARLSINGAEFWVGD